MAPDIKKTIAEKLLDNFSTIVTVPGLTKIGKNAAYWQSYHQFVSGCVHIKVK